MLVASLALALERKLREAGLRLSTRAAWEALERVNLLEFEVEGNGVQPAGVKAEVPPGLAEGERTVH